MIQVTKSLGEIRIDNGKDFIWVTETEARQLIADIMAALGEPMKPSDAILNLLPDTTTQAYQEFADKPEISFKPAPYGQGSPEGFQEWYELYQFAVKNGYAK